MASLRFVVDANILLAGVIRDSSTRKLLLEPRLELAAPQRVVEEVLKHVSSDAEVIEKTRLSPLELETIARHLLSEVAVCPEGDYLPHLPEAKLLAAHDEDAPYLALAIKLGCPIWSNDLDMKRQTRVSVLATKEIVSSLLAQP